MQPQTNVTAKTEAAQQTPVSKAIKYLIALLLVYGIVMIGFVSISYLTDAGLNTKF